MKLINQKVRFQEIFVALAVTVSLVFSLCGCANSASSPSTLESKTASHEIALKTNAELQPKSPDSLTGTPIGLVCDQIFTQQALYDYNPNFALIPNGNFINRTTSEQVAGVGGITCIFENLSTNVSVSLAIAKLSPESIQSVKDRLNNSNLAVSKIGSHEDVNLYFNSANDIGKIEVTSDVFWIVAESSWFKTADEAKEFINAALQATKR